MSSQQIEQQRQPARHENNNSNPDKDIQAFLLRRRSMDANRHMETAHDRDQESHALYATRFRSDKKYTKNARINT